MNNKQFGEGLQVSVPDDFEILDLPVDAPRTRESKRFSGTVPMPASTSDQKTHDAIVNILKESDLELINEIDIQPRAAAGASKREVSGESTAELKIDLKSDEEAVILIEQDGMYTWKYASSVKPSSSQRKRRGTMEPTDKTLVFTIELDVLESGTEGKKRGLADIIDFSMGKLKAFVLKFAAARTIAVARNLLEKNVKKGIVHINSKDPQTWKKVRKLGELNLPLDKAASILILMHGTFSSTVGGFGALAGTPWGENFLQTALENYDAIIGYDHLTLKEDPLQNAEEIMQLLNDYHFAHTPTFDVVAHSRGGLVIRSLIEKLLPKAKQEIRINRVIFVACTNGGTLLAEPSNWQSLINLYTNLTAGACRVIGMISPQTKVITTILRDVIESIGSFVKYCAEEAITNKALPGLSAMEPDGDFVKDINDFQVGQPAIADTNYCVITSEFEPSLSGNHEPKELPKRFLQLLSGGFIDQLMKEANDLVVNTRSMDAIDIETGNYVRHRFDFGKNAQVYHTNFFTRPEVMGALTNWLELQPVKSLEKEILIDPKTVIPRRRSRGTGVNYKLPTAKEIFGEQLQPLGNKVLNTIAVSPAVDTDIIIVNANDEVQSVKVQIEQKTPSYVVVRRRYQDTVLNYAFKGEEALQMSMANSGDVPLIYAFNLHETDASDTQAPDAAIEKKKSDSTSPTRGRNVVVVGNVPVGVVPEKEEIPGAEDLAAIAQSIKNPLTDKDKILYRRAMPSMIMKGKSVSAPDPKVSSVLCHFHAELDAEVLVKRMTSLVITVSREMIKKITGIASKVASGQVEKKKPLIIRVIAKSGFVIEDATEGRIETDVPLPDQPREFYVDLRATEKEGEGEIWVVVRQGSVPIVKLVLNPQIVVKRKLTSDRLVAETDAEAPAELVKPLHQLWIEEYKTSDGFGYKFDLYSEQLKINRQFKSEVIEEEKVDRKKYVDGLYKKIEDRWISSNKDVANFEQELRALGADLFDELIPKDLKNILWNNRNNFGSIQVISTEPFMPWELVHLRKPDEAGMPDETIFLGQMGLIRWLEGAGKTGWPAEKIMIRNKRVRYVIPHYPHPDYVLAEAEEEAAFLEKKFEAVRVEPESGKVRELISKKGSFDLLHFACHGAADSSGISDAKLLMEGRVEKDKYILDELLATVAAKFSKLKSDDNTPMVVLNACQAGKAGYKLTGIGGFANAFLMAGAGAFVGTLWSIGDSPARIFTEALYDALDSGKNLSEATIIARSKAKKEGEATWLAYVVYGHPHLTIVRE